jgi:hypothetical protein
MYRDTDGEILTGEKSKYLDKNLSLGHFVHHLMFVDPCIIVQFIKKNPKRCNNV